MILIKDYRNLSQYIPKVRKKTKISRAGINYSQFIGQIIVVHTLSGKAFQGILVHDWPRGIVLILKIGNQKNLFSIKAVIRKSSVTAVVYQYA